jgi:hypothetical protein
VLERADRWANEKPNGMWLVVADYRLLQAISRSFAMIEKDIF